MVAEEISNVPLYIDAPTVAAELVILVIALIFMLIGVNAASSATLPARSAAWIE